jgi:asparagine synthase (glutamine-hydrolysing)
MLRGAFNCSGGPAREIEAIDRLSRTAGEGGLLTIGPLALARGASVASGELDGVHWTLDGHLQRAADPPGPGGQDAALVDDVGRGYRRVGTDVLLDLRGAFSLVLWDSDRRQGLLTCDLLATRQLFIWRGAGCLLFATELDELLELVPTRPSPDQTGFLMWLAGGICPAGTTLYSGVSRLGPGEALELSATSTPVRTYWRPRYAGTLSGSRAELAAELRDQLERSTARRLSQRSTGVVLSGGFDSSIVTAFAARTKPAGSRLRTYSAVFPGAEYDESDKIQQLTAALDIDPATFLLEPQGTLRMALEHTQRWQLPLTGAGALIDVAMVAEAAGDGASVVLDGQTGDEVLGFAPYLVADRLRRGRLLAALELTRRWPLGRPTTIKDQVWILRNLGLKGMAPYRLARHVVRRRNRKRAKGPDWLRPDMQQRYAGLEDRWAWKTGATGPLWWRHLADVLVDAPHRELRLDYLRHRAAAVGVVNESPLYDFDLIGLCLRLPPELAFDSRFTRPLAREAVEGIVPDAVRLQTQKAVFSSFVAKAIAGPDGPGIGRLLMAPDAELGGYVDLDYVRTLWQRGQPRARFGSTTWGTTVWRLAAAEVWLRLQSSAAVLDDLLASPDVPSVSIRASP